MIPLMAVAPDARSVIAAFREAGSVSFQDVDLAEARAIYVATCRANGPRSDRSIPTRDMIVAGVPCREYLPGADPPRAVGAAVLFLHGGGWVVGDLDTHDLLCRDLALATGARVIAVDYRLAPEHPFPAAHDDATAVAAALLGDGAGLVDPTRVALVGDSAGGNLAAWIAAEAARGCFAHQPLGQVLLYPVTDLTCTQPSHRRITEGFPLTAATMRWFAESYAPGPVERTDPRVSPLLHPVVPGHAPAFVCTAGLDPLADEGIAYAAALAAAGTAVEHHHFPCHGHGLITSAGRIETGRRILDRVAAFIRETLAESV